MSNQETLFILDMVDEGKLTVPEAVELIDHFSDDDALEENRVHEIEVSVRMH